MAKRVKRLQRFREWALHNLATPFRLVCERWLVHRKIVILYCVLGDGIGDALALTTILKFLYDRQGTKGIVFSMRPELFLHNPMVLINLSYHEMSRLKRSLLKSLLRALRGSRVICFGGEVWTVGMSPFSLETIDDARVPGVAWIDRLLPDGGVGKSLAGLRPAIFFSTVENEQFSRKFSDVTSPFGLIKATTGLNRPASTALKDWSVQGFADVVSKFPEIHWVQVGERSEPIVLGVTSLLGKTSIREVLWLLSKSKLLLSVEGFLTHAAAAFDVPTVVPFTGVHDPEGLLYPNTIPVAPDPRPPCMPCWHEVCIKEGMPCRTNISSKSVEIAVQKALCMDRANA